MNLMWLIPIAVLAFFLWAGWKSRRRSPNPPDNETHRRGDGAYYSGGGGS